jgi:predicted nucleic-acid-binding Zn-ribbon protein
MILALKYQPVSHQDKTYLNKNKETNMLEDKKCPECGNTNLYRSDNVSSGGGDAPNYLPGLGNFFNSAKFRMVVCQDCGLTRFFAAREALSKISESNKWTRF